MGAVVTGVDPRKRSATIEIMDNEEKVLGGGRYGTNAACYRDARGGAAVARARPGD